MLIKSYLAQHLGKGPLYAISGAIFAGAFYIPYQKALHHTTPEVFVLAFCIASIGLHFLLLLGQRRGLSYNRTTVIGAAGFAMLSNLGNYCVGMCLAYLSAAAVSVLSRTQILMVMVLSTWLFKESLHRKTWVAACGAMLGIMIMASDGMHHQGDAFWGVFWGLGGALSFALTHSLTKAIIHRIEPVSYNVIRITFAAVMMALLPGVLDQLWQDLDHIWHWALSAAALGPCLSRLCQTFALRHAPLSQVVLATFLTPVSAAVFGFIFLSHWPTFQEQLGGAIILICLIWLSWPSRDHSPSASA